MQHTFITIGNKKIGDGQPCFIVAEMSGNHNQNINRAYKIIDEAAKAGVDAIKFQTYTPDTMTFNSSKKWFRIKQNKQWGGQTLYELYNTAYTPWQWHKNLFTYAQKKRLIVFSTPFDVTAVDFLEKLHVPLYKIASFELIHLPLLKRVARTKKPVILSRGMATVQEIKEAIYTLKKYGASQIVLLHCISSYPATLEQMNVATVVDIRKRFGVLSGLSDHSLGSTASVAAVALGACIVEKHFTLNRADGGPDYMFSLEPAEMKQLVTAVRDTEKAIGKASYKLNKNEKEFSIYKPSIFVVKPIKKGDKFTKDNIHILRPAYGLKPRYYESILGKISKRNIKEGTPLQWSMINR